MSALGTPDRGKAEGATGPLGALLMPWSRRGLLQALVARDLRTRYAGSSAGLLWAVVGPLLQIAILTTVFSMVLRVRFGEDARVPFALALAWGLFPWIAFQEGVSRATTSLTDGGVLLKRMAFPAEVVLTQPVLSAAAQLVVALGVLLVLMPLFGVFPAASTPLCLLPLLLQVLLATGVGWILGVLNVYLRDTAQLVVAALQAWFYLTPIVYSADSAPPGLRGLLSLNPLSGIVEGFRAFALGGPVPWGALAWSACAALAALAAGAALVAKARSEMADLV
ncbi:MAG: ABC transporter permease [Alphaproteobacteria bacterium]